MQCAIGVVVLLAICGWLSGCDSYPIAELKNDASEPIVLELMFAPTKGGILASRATYEVQPGRSIRFPSGELLAPRMVLRSRGCSYEFEPRPKSDGAIDSGYGAVTKLAVGSDLRVFVRGWAGDLGMSHPREAATQPVGWPWSPTSKDCH